MRNTVPRPSHTLHSTCGAYRYPGVRDSREAGKNLTEKPLTQKVIASSFEIISFGLRRRSISIHNARLGMLFRVIWKKRSWRLRASIWRVNPSLPGEGKRPIICLGDEVDLIWIFWICRSRLKLRLRDERCGTHSGHTYSSPRGVGYLKNMDYLLFRRDVKSRTIDGRRRYFFFLSNAWNKSKHKTLRIVPNEQRFLMKMIKRLVTLWCSPRISNSLLVPLLKQTLFPFQHEHTLL